MNQTQPPPSKRADDQVARLEQAILARAERLAAEYRERAERGRDNILHEAAARLRERQAREEEAARALGERTERREVQANEITLERRLDRIRWQLIEDVEHQLAERLRDYQRDWQSYSDWLIELIVQAARRFASGDELHVRANAADLQTLTACWEKVEAALPEGIIATLEQDEAAPLATLGGVLVTSADGRVRIDQTYEGRHKRLRTLIHQTIFDNLSSGHSGDGATSG